MERQGFQKITFLEEGFEMCHYLACSYNLSL